MKILCLWLRCLKKSRQYSANVHVIHLYVHTAQEAKGTDYSFSLSNLNMSQLKADTNDPKAKQINHRQKFSCEHMTVSHSPVKCILVELECLLYTNGHYAVALQCGQ